jgi:hypothetical protein
VWTKIKKSNPMRFEFLAQLKLSLQVTGRRVRKLKSCPFCKMPGYLYKELKHTIHFRQYEAWVNKKDPRVASWCEFDTRRSYQLWAHPHPAGTLVHPSRLSPPTLQGPPRLGNGPTTVIDAVPTRRSAWIGRKPSRGSEGFEHDDPWREEDVPF